MGEFHGGPAAASQGPELLHRACSTGAAVMQFFHVSWARGFARCDGRLFHGKGGAPSPHEAFTELYGYCRRAARLRPGSCVSQSRVAVIEVEGAGSVGTCVFPFTYSGTTYTECAEPAEYGGVGWCAWDNTYKRGRWGYCTETCPKSGAPPH